MTLTSETLRANREARGMLWAFDFLVTDNREFGPVWFETAPLEPFDIVAQRSSGCIYALIGPQRHVLLIASEGQAGIVAASLKECLELVVTYPYWQDVLRFGKGDLSVIRQVLRDRGEEFEDQTLDDNPEIEEFRPLLRSQLRLDQPRDPVELLHRTIVQLGATLIVRDHDGNRLEALV